MEPTEKFPFVQSKLMLTWPTDIHVEVEERKRIAKQRIPKRWRTEPHLSNSVTRSRTELGCLSSNVSLPKENQTEFFLWTEFFELNIKKNQNEPTDPYPN